MYITLSQKKMFAQITQIILLTLLISLSLITYLPGIMELSEKIALIAIYITIYFSFYTIMQNFLDKMEKKLENEREMKRIFQKVENWLNTLFIEESREKNPDLNKGKLIIHTKFIRFLRSMEGTYLNAKIFEDLGINFDIYKVDDYELIGAPKRHGRSPAWPFQGPFCSDLFLVCGLVP